MEVIARRTGWIVMYVMVILLSIASLRYFVPGMPDAFQPDIYADRVLLIRVHILFSMVAVLVGPLQFWSTFRNRNPKIHKITGLVYITGVSVGCLGALMLAPISHGGLVTHIGFSVLAILWFSTTIRAYSLILNHDWHHHREWMIRSYALGFAFVMLRFWFPVFQALGAPEAEAYQATAWVCWVPNLLIAEVYIGWYRNRSTIKS